MGRKGKKKQNVQDHPHSSISQQQSSSQDQQQNPSGSQVSQQVHSQHQQSDISQKHACPKQQSDSPQQTVWKHNQQQQQQLSDSQQQQAQTSGQQQYQHISPQQPHGQRQQSNSPQQQAWRSNQQQQLTSPQQPHSQRQQSNSPQQQAWKSNQQQQLTSPQQPHGQRQQSNSPQQQAWKSNQQQQLTSPQQPHGQRQQSNSPQQQAWKSNQQQQLTSPQQPHGQRQQSNSPQQQAWKSNQQQQLTSPQQPHGQRQQSNSPQQQAWKSNQQQQLTSPQQPHGQRQQSNSPQQQAWKSNQQQQFTSPQQPHGQRQQSNSPQQQAWRSNQQQQHSSPQQLHGQRQQSNSPQQQAWRSNQQQQHSSPQQLHGQRQQSNSPQQQAWKSNQQQQQTHDERQQLSISQVMSESHQEQQQPSDSQQQELHSQQQSSVSQISHDSKQSQQETALVSKKIDSLTQNIHDMYVTQMPKRTNQTNKPGRNIIVETNMLKLIFAQNFQTNIIHYDVIITPDKPKFLLRTVFEEFRKKQCPKRYPAFDGKKNAYSAQNLPFGDKSKEEEIKIFDVNTGREKNFKIYLNKVASLDLSWLKNLKCDLMDSERNQKCIQALEIILRHGPAYQYTVIGRSLFQQPEPGRVVSLSNGLDLWVGVFQSVVIGSKPYLNIDVAHKGFPKSQSVIDLMKELCNVQDLTPKVVEQNLFNINKFLKGLKIQYELPGQPTTKRTYRVNKLVNSARENKFRLEDQTLYSVEQYFLQIKKYTIKYPTLPCLWVGSQKNSIYLPAELCTIIAGQVIQKDMNKIQTSKMIRETATDTRKRKEKIMNNFANMNLNQQPTLMDEFHFSVNPEFEKIPARVLEAPKLQYKEKEVNVKKGIWKAEKFFIPCILPKKSWTILNLDNRIYNHDLYNLYEKLQNGGKFLNMEIAEALTPFANLTIETNINKIIEYFNDKKKQKILLVVVILPNLDNAYSIVKQICELQIHEGIVTQCIKNQTLKKLNDSTIGNILLKINSKLNGINHIITPTCRPNCLRKPCMIIGADVTHPSPDAINTPSIAAVAASHDPNAFKYNVEIRLQSPREEIIQDLEEIMIIQLKYFFGITRQKPQKLIFYRDGVSEGHLKQVIHKELSAIKRAIARLEKSNDIKIPITFLVVQKRHHVRFFPTDVKNSDDKNFNVQAGTIVDTEITHPTHIDFYLVSHTSIQGTARPTKYRCICNENQMPENEIEQLTYYLCHMFARCTRSVSYPAPTYYAHLAAFRARALIHNTSLNIENLQEEQRKKMTLKINKSSPMFFV